MKLVIVDDKPGNLEITQRAVGGYFDKNKIKASIRAFSNPEAFLNYLKESEGDCDILILDIDLGMRGGNGIDIAKTLNGKYPLIKIIFITAYSQYAKDISEADFVYILIKPLEESKLIAALDKTLSLIEEENKDLLAINCRNIVYKVNAKHITYIESYDRKISIHTVNQPELIMAGKLSDMEELLKSRNNFLRCHQSFIVNMDKINKISGSNIILFTGESINIPRKRQKDVAEAFMNYVGKKF
ncbi:MAG: response regulator transcription factor [Eubacteriaceae bacterium]|nr:response regulator transcription factor [Eubacteriaceae bacterium]